jgi:type IV secretory pathway VirB2 component (pilin)
MKKVELLKRLGKGMFKSVLVFGALTTSAFAFTAPSGGFMYDIYKLVVQDLIQGPVGAATGVAAMVYGGIRLIMGQWGGAVWPIIGGAVLYKADALANSIGMTIRNY